MTWHDAVDMMTMLSLVHRKLDGAHRIHSPSQADGVNTQMDKSLFERLLHEEEGPTLDFKRDQYCRTLWNIALHPKKETVCLRNQGLQVRFLPRA